MPASSKSPRKPRKATAKSLENAAIYYLQRYSSSAENLRRVLARRVERSVRVHETSREEGLGFIDDILRRFLANGLLNDRDYAESKAAFLFRRGGSKRAIGHKLHENGVDREIIDAALRSLAAEHGDPDTQAAKSLARRRGLGPYRPGTERQHRREKDLAAMARAGFDYQTARRIIDAESVDALDRLG